MYLFSDMETQSENIPNNSRKHLNFAYVIISTYALERLPGKLSAYVYSSLNMCPFWHASTLDICASASTNLLLMGKCINNQ